MSYLYIFYGSSEPRALKTLQVQMSNNLQLIRLRGSGDIPKITQMLIKKCFLFLESFFENPSFVWSIQVRI